MYIAICDDDKQYLAKVDKYMQRFQKTFGDVKWRLFERAEDVWEYYKRNGNKFDVLITDIEMGEMSGIELANSVRERDRNVIIFYMTNYTEYAVKCFRAEPLNFWVKPLSYKVVSEDLQRAHDRILQSREYVTIIENRERKDIKYNDIIYLETWGKKTLIHTCRHDYKTNKSLSDFQRELDKDRFVRVNQTYIINYEYVRDFTKNSIEIYDVNGSMPIGRTYMEDWRKGFMNYNRRRLLEK